MSVEWPDFKFPPINLLVLPRHSVIIDAISSYYAKHYPDFWDDVAFRQQAYEGQLDLEVKGMYNVEHDN